MNSLFKSLTSKSLMDRCFLTLVQEWFENAADRANPLIKGGEYKRVNKDGGYTCIHLHLDQFMSAMRSLVTYMNWKPKHLRRLKFIDVGCGVGQKVFVAHLLGFDSYGLELRKELVEEAKNVTANLHMFKTDRCATNFFMLGDALKFKNYSDYDVIYFYCPLFKHELQVKLEKRVQTQAKKGAIVIGFLPHDFDNIGDTNTKNGWKLIGMNMWQKQ